MLPEFIEDLILPGKELLGDRPDPEHFSPTKMMTLWDTVLGELRVVGGHPWQKYRCLNSLRVLLEEQGDVYGYGLCPYTGQIVVSEAVKGRFFFFPFLCSSHQSNGLQGALLQDSLELSGHLGAFPLLSR